jgi:hypothetical protein
MADDTVLPGTGETYAADEVGGVKHQRVKLSIGENGTAVDASAAAPVPIQAEGTTKDSLTNALICISYEHHEVHEGDAFVVDVEDESMADTDTLSIAFKTPAGTKRAHIVAEFVTLVGGELEIWEGPTWTTNTGTLVDIINRKRLAAMTSSILLEDITTPPTFAATDAIMKNVTGLATGAATRLSHLFAWGVQNKFGAGGGRDESEILLKPETQYAFVFTAIGNSNKAQLILHWYEHTDSN